MPQLIFDGDCGFCRHCVRWLQARTGDRVRYESFQAAKSLPASLSETDLRQAVHLIEDGNLSRGAEAIFRALASAPGYGAWLWGYRNVPGFAALTEGMYRLVASNRYVFSRLMRALWGTEIAPATHGLVSNVYLRALGFVYLAAFLSLLSQVDGLVGSRGILPAMEFLSSAKNTYGSEAYTIFPTLGWLSASDSALRAMAGGGVALAILLIAGVVPKLCCLVLWGLFLSLVNLGNVFTQYQWEALLLEAGFLAIWIAPARLFQGFVASRSPSRALVLLQRWLLFRLVFFSGIAKMISGDVTWSKLTALAYHYETQPLPTALAWYLHQLPLWFQRVSTAATLAAEILGPILFFLPRRLRLFGFWIQVVLQLLLILTGNYAYFNWLTLALCLFLLDDGDIANVLPKRIPSRVEAARSSWVSTGWALVIFLVSVLRTGQMSGPAASVLFWFDRFQIVNTYGLFVHMTTQRNEIEIEGSRDGREWRIYPFRWKPGNPEVAPSFVAPHQPRIDWQAWFAALGDFEHQYWLQRLLLRIFENEKVVLDLFADNPFPEGRPKYLRVRFYEYKFSRGGKAWWDKKLVGEYSPVVSPK